MTIIIETERLTLRTWKEEDAETYFQINQDPKVIEFLRAPLTMEQVKEFILMANIHDDKHGYTLWATCLKETGNLLGFIGLNYTDWVSHFTPAVEVGWRLRSQYWGKGYAAEGAKASLAYGFKKCGLKEIVSFTVPANVRSLRVMEKIGLRRDLNGDFAHPKLPTDHPLSGHVLYRLSADEYFMKFREITENDISELFAIRIKTRENTLSMDELARHGITPESIANSLLTDVKGWLCEINTKIVGFAMGNKTTGEMLVIALLPDYEGLGIGKQLLTLVENWLFAQGHKELWLTTSPDPKIRSNGFYKKLGWVATGIMEGNDEVFKKYKL